MNGHHEISEGLLMMNHENYPVNNQEAWFEEEIDVDLKWSFALNRCACLLMFLIC